MSALFLAFSYIKNNFTEIENADTKNVNVSSTQTPSVLQKQKESAPAHLQNESVQPPASVDTKSDPDSFLIEKDFIEDPDNPDQLIKKTHDANGKSITFYVQKNSSIEPNNASEKTALETLESKRDIDPQFEYESLKKFDDTNQNDGLLSGSFRNNELDLEFKILMTYSGSQYTNFSGINFCFSSPNLNIDIPLGTEADLRTDGTGYGIIKLSNNSFLRLAWSMEAKRKIHGQIIRTQQNISELVLSFEALQYNSLEGKYLKRCASKNRK